MTGMLVKILALALLLHSCIGAKKVILVSLDGFRHDYIEMAEKAGKDVSAFKKIASLGFRAMAVESVMLSLTFPSHFSLATGRYVDRHGLVGNHFYDPNYKETYTYTNSTNAMQPKWFTMNGNEPIWLTNQRNGGQSCVFYWPGSDSRMYGEMMFTNFGLYSGVPPLRFRVDRIMDWITQPDINFCMLYFNEPDSKGHAYGPDSPEVMDAVQQVNDGIAYLMQRLEESTELTEKPNLIVTSDHGMTRVWHDKVVPIQAVLSNEDYYFDYDGSPANVGIWPKDNSAAGIETIYQKLKSLRNCQVYKKADIPEIYHYKNNERIAPIVVIAELGWMILTNMSDPYSSTLNGMHGYDNQAADMHPFLVAMGPGIKQRGTIQTFQQIDVYPLVCMLLDIFKPNRIDGDVNRVLPLLSNPPSNDKIQQFILYAKGTPDSSSSLGFSVLLNVVLAALVQRIVY